MSNDEIISIGNYFDAYYLCRDIDPKDTAFVALTIELEADDLRFVLERANTILRSLH